MIFPVEVGIALKDILMPVRMQIIEQWQQGVFKDLSPATNLAISAFGQAMIVEDRQFLRKYLTNSKFDTFQELPPRPESERMIYAKARIIEFVATAKSTFFNTDKGNALSQDTTIDQINLFASRVFDLVDILNPKGLTKDGCWEQAVGPLLLAEVFSQFSNNSEYLAFDGPKLPEDHMLQALTKTFFDRVPPESQERWLKTMGRYSPGEFDNWLRTFDKLDDRGYEVQGKFMQWAHQS